MKTIFFCLLKKEINLNILRFFFEFFRNILEEAGYFNFGFVSYNVNIQPDIMQNW
jgi:hypothetical protein